MRLPWLISFLLFSANILRGQDEIPNGLRLAGKPMLVKEITRKVSGEGTKIKTHRLKKRMTVAGKGAVAVFRFDTTNSVLSSAVLSASNDTISQLIYSYDQNHRVTRLTNLNDHKIDYTSVFHYHSSTSDRCDSVSFFKRDSVPDGVQTWGKDSSGLEQWSLRTGKHISQRYEYHFNKEMKLTGYEMYTVSDEKKEWSRAVTFEYDSSGRIVKKTYAEANYKDSYHYRYNEHNDIVAIAYFHKNGKLFRTRNFQYEYDAQGNWIKMTEFRNGKAVMVIEREIIYFPAN
jgi:hypothetical protein